MDLSELYLKTAFCCMASDGKVAEEEIAVVQKYAERTDLFNKIDVESKINEYVDNINENGVGFIEEYLRDLKSSGLDDKEALQCLKLAIQLIESDDNIEYSEVAFFKRIRSCLGISDEAILEEMPDKEDYLLPDIASPVAFDWNMKLPEISIKIADYE